VYLLGLAAVVGAAALFGLIGPALHAAGDLGLGPLAVPLARAVGATAVTALIALRLRPRCLLSPFRAPRAGFLSGFFGVFGIYAATNYGMLHVPLALAVTLFYTAPFWVLLLGHLWGKEPFSTRAAVAAAIALVGVRISLGVSDGAERHWLGMAAMVAGGISYAAYILLGRYGPAATDPLGSYLATFFWGSVILLPLALATGELSALLRAPSRAWLPLGYLIVGPTLGSYGLLLFALRHIEGRVASVLSMTEIAFAAFWGFVFLDQRPALSVWFGAATIVVAVVILTRPTRASRPPTASSPE
jgi:drug/metabolite transporter (DMT)-like permease